MSTLEARNTIAGSQFVPQDCFPITPGEPFEVPAVRGIRANTAGTIDVVTGADEERTINILAGETRWLLITAVSAATATGLEGLI